MSEAELEELRAREVSRKEEEEKLEEELGIGQTRLVPETSHPA